jgi:hypothetical protein
MHPITIRGIGPFEAVGLKFELIQAGLIMDDDFFWQYIPAKWDNFSGEVHGKYAVFHFREPALATFYKLKWT